MVRRYCFIYQKLDTPFLWKFLSSLPHSVDIFDELIAELMLKWLERNHLILFSQFAVRFDHSTLNRARDDIEQGFIVVKIFDINKALNRTSHETLFVALNEIGFLVFLASHALKWTHFLLMDGRVQTIQSLFVACYITLHNTAFHF